MQLERKKEEIEKEIQKIYRDFREIYTEENYEDWFKTFKKDNKKKYGDKGYKENKAGHALGHYAILQTPIPELQEIPEKTKIIIVGKNNSWFDPSNMRKSLEIVRGLKEGIPKKNYYTERKSDFAKAICSIFKNLNKFDLLEKNTVGINRIWLQTGGDTREFNRLVKSMKIPRKNQSIIESLEDTSIVGICHKWTEKIIKLLNPELVIILGRGYECANKLFDKTEGDYQHKNGKFFIKHCRHPSHGGKGKLEDQIKKEMHRFIEPLQLPKGFKFTPSGNTE